MRILSEMEFKFFWFFVLFLDGFGMKGLMCAGDSFDLHVRPRNVVKRYL